MTLPLVSVERKVTGESGAVTPGAPSARKIQAAPAAVVRTLEPFKSAAAAMPDRRQKTAARVFADFRIAVSVAPTTGARRTPMLVSPYCPALGSFHPGHSGRWTP